MLNFKNLQAYNNNSNARVYKCYSYNFTFDTLIRLDNTNDNKKLRIGTTKKTDRTYITIL